MKTIITTTTPTLTYFTHTRKGKVSGRSLLFNRKAIDNFISYQVSIK